MKMNIEFVMLQIVTYSRLIVMKKIKQMAKSILPEIVVKKIRNTRNKYRYKGLNTKEIFSKIYEEGVWGKSDNSSRPFCSGSGSYNDAIVSVYVEGVLEFLKTFPAKPDVVDLGCGDFYVGSKVRPWCGNYIACDVVPKLIEFNKTEFGSLNVDFRVLDLICEDFVPADIVFIRQVLQHLSNSEIKKVIPKLAKNFRFLVLTEHIPAVDKFIHNVEKPTGPGIRLDSGGGVVLTSAPFNLVVKDERILCEVKEMGGVIRTTLYQLN